MKAAAGNRTGARRTNAARASHPGRVARGRLVCRFTANAAKRLRPEFPGERRPFNALCDSPPVRHLSRTNRGSRPYASLTAISRQRPRHLRMQCLYFASLLRRRQPLVHLRLCRNCGGSGLLVEVTGKGRRNSRNSQPRISADSGRLKMRKARPKPCLSFFGMNRMNPCRPSLSLHPGTPAASAILTDAAAFAALWPRSGGCVRGLPRRIGRPLPACARCRLRDRSAS